MYEVELWDGAVLRHLVISRVKNASVMFGIREGSLHRLLG